MRKSISVFLFLFIILSINLFSQVTEEWVRRYNGAGNSNDRGFSIKLDKLENVIVSGISGDSLIVIKYNNMGQQIWTSSFRNAYSMIIGKSLDVDQNGNAYIVGSGNWNIFTVKFDSNGIQCWAKVYSSTGYSSDEGKKIVVGKDGYVYVLGQTSPVQYDFKYLTIKYNPTNGDTLWTRIFDIGAGVGPSDMVLDDNCNIFITGVSSAITTIKYDSSGNLKWVSEPEFGTPFAIGLDKAGNIYVTGEIYNDNPVEMDCKTIKYDSNGVIKWVRLYNNNYVNHYDEAFSLAIDDSSNVLIGGFSEDINYNDDYLVVKYNTNGVEQWTARYLNTGFHSDWITKIAVDRYGNSYVTGHTSFNGTYTRQFTTIKYSNSGNQIWVKHYNYTGEDGVANDLILDSLLNVYITGSSKDIVTGLDITTIKYSQPIGIQPISSEIPSSFSLSQNYPNPFNPSTKIKFSIPPLRGDRGVTKLAVYDILGREIAVLVNEQLSPGTYEVEWSAVGGGTNYPSGVYFYKLITEGFTETKKMVLLK